MDEKEAALSARLWAIEYMIANLYAQTYRAKNPTADEVFKWHAEAINRLRENTVPVGDPVKSDHLAAEIEAAVSRILKSIEEMLGLRKNPYQR
jgi:uncharacterized membrane protein YfbV (UPF0208 family)